MFLKTTVGIVRFFFTIKVVRIASYVAVTMILGADIQCL